MNPHWVWRQHPRPRKSTVGSSLVKFVSSELAQSHVLTVVCSSVMTSDWQVTWHGWNKLCPNLDLRLSFLSFPWRQGSQRREWAWDEFSFGQSEQRCLNVRQPTCDGFFQAWQRPRLFKLLWLVYFTAMFCANVCSKITLPIEFSTKGHVK